MSGRKKGPHRKYPGETLLDTLGYPWIFKNLQDMPADMYRMYSVDINESVSLKKNTKGTHNYYKMK